jgi:hypothetical protein
MVTSRSAGVQSGLPLSAPQWRWDVGFYPIDHRGRSRTGYASRFDQVRAAFEAAWQDYLPQCTEDFAEHRRQRTFTAWKYAMHDAGLPLPTQSATGRARCFWGAEIDLANVASGWVWTIQLPGREKTVRSRTRPLEVARVRAVIDEAVADAGALSPSGN